MTTSLAELITPDSSATILQRLLDLMTLGGFPATAWQTLSVPRQLLQAESSWLADLSTAISSICEGGFLDYAVQRELAGTDSPGSSFLELIATNFFQIERNGSLQTQGTLTVSDVGGVGPTTVNPGLLTVSEGTKTFQFQNLAQFTVPLNGSATVEIQAVSPGAAYNLAIGQITTFITSYPGLACANVANPISQTWITQAGNDVEGPQALATRCQNKWSSLSAGGTLQYYQYYATTGFPEVARTLIAEDFNTGIVTIVLAASNGPVGGATLAAEQALFANSASSLVRGMCIQLAVASAIPSTSSGTDISTVSGTLYVSASADLAGTVAAAENAIVAYSQTVGIGGIVRASELSKAITSVAGVYDWTPTSVLANIQLAYNMVWTPIPSITGSR